MTFVNTVLGPIHPEQLGITAPHEHVVWPPPRSEDPAWLDELPRAVEKQFNDLIDFRLRGGRTVVDISGPGLGRDLDVLGLLAKSTGINIVVSTGVGPGQSPVGDTTALEEGFVRELSQGIGHTNVKAGLIAVEVNEDWPPARGEIICRAAKRAAQLTGAAVAVHGAHAEQWIDWLMGEGLPGQRIIVGHRDAALDVDRDTALARRGVYLGHDHIGVEGWSRTPFGRDDAQRVTFIKAMIEAGHGEQLLLSCDTNCPALGTATPPLHSLGYLLRCFVPRLREVGIPEATIQRLLVENPRRALAIA